MMTRVPFFTLKSPMLQRNTQRGKHSEKHIIKHGSDGMMLVTGTGPSRALRFVPGVTKGHMGNEKRGYRTDP